MKTMTFVYFALILFFSSACNSNENKLDVKSSASQEIDTDIDTNYCKCGYFGIAEKKNFLALQDSISKTLLSENDSIAVYGYHSGMIKDLLFIKNGKIAETYDLRNNAALASYTDSTISAKLYRHLVNNLDSFKNGTRLKMGQIDHPTAYTFSFYTKSKKLSYCICDQITDDGNSLNNMRIYFRDNYVLPKVEKFRQSLK